MRKPGVTLLIIAATAVVLGSCSGQPGPQAQLDATGLKYVARERVQDRTAEERKTLPDAPQLEGFTQPLRIVDGKVPLTLEDVIRRTVKNSLTIQVASYTPAMAEADLDAASAIFDPTFFISGNILKTDVPNTSFLAVAGNKYLEENTRTASIGIRKPMATGGTLTLTDNFRYFKSTSPLVTSPQFPQTYSTDFTLELAQPLLRNMGLDVNKAQIYIASHRRDGSIEQFRGGVMDLLVQVEQTYWQLVFAVRDVEVRKQSMAQAQAVYEKEKNREAQQMAKPLEVSRAKAAVLQRKAELIRAEEVVKNASDQLKDLMNDPELPLLQDVVIFPADEPMIIRPDTEAQRAAATAIVNRPELQQARDGIKALEAQLRFTRNQLLPQLDLSFLMRRNAVEATAANAWSDQWTGRFADYGAGLTFQVPLGNRQAEAKYRRSQLELEQNRRNLEKITQEAIFQVNSAIREIQTNLEEVAATREARIAAKDTLDGEQASFDVGETTNDELLRVQADYAAAQRAEIQAVTNLNTSTMLLERAKGTLLDYNNIHVLPKDYQNARKNPQAAVPPAAPPTK